MGDDTVQESIFQLLPTAWQAAVESMKALVIRAKKVGENLKQAVALWRNMKRQNGSSPAELFWGKTQCHRLPIPKIHLVSSQTAKGRDRQQTEVRNTLTAQFMPLQLRNSSLMGNAITGKWKKRSRKQQWIQAQNHTRCRTAKAAPTAEEESF